MASLPVELNRDRRHEVRVVGSFEANGPFGVDLTNHGDGVHVHLSLDGDLARVASLDGTNHYVDAESTSTVMVDVSPVDEPVSGELTLATGYGSEKVTVEVTVAPFEGPSAVQVDEDLSKPSGGATPAVESDTGGVGGAPSLSMLGIAGVAVAVAVVVGWYVDSPAVLVGTGVVVGAAVAAVVLSLR